MTPASGSLDDAVTAINGSAAGVTATKVAAGTATDGTKLFRLQLTATKTGAASAFQVYRGTGDQVTAGTATNVLTQTGAAVVTAAKDASVTLWAGTDAAQTVTSATNTFTDLLPGVDVTVSAPSSDPVTVTIGQDTSKAQAVASGLVDALNAITAYYGTNTAVTSTTSPTTGTTSTTAGVLTGDATTRDVVQRLTSTMSTPVNGKSPSSIGIVITKDGDFTFDAAAFQKALADDPDGTQAVLSGVATNVGAAATAASDKYTGSITTSITGQQSVATDLTTQIDSWDRPPDAASGHPAGAVRGARDEPEQPAVPVLLHRQPPRDPVVVELTGATMNAFDLQSAAFRQSAQPRTVTDQRRAQYTNEAVLSATPAQLVTMLYDRLMLDLHRAEAAQTGADWDAAREQLLHAQAIVGELSSTLRIDVWDGGEGLLAIYNYASTSLITANVHRDVQATRDCIRILEPLRQSWHEAAAALPATRPLPGATGGALGVA